MAKKLLSLAICLTTVFNYVIGQVSPLEIYKGSTNLLSNSWNQNLTTLADTTADSPYEGDKHMLFQFAVTNYWAGGSFSVNSWGNDTIDISAYTHIVVASKGMSVDDSLGGSTNSTFNISIADTNGVDGVGTFGPSVQIGATNAEYKVDTISIAQLVGTSGIDVHAISQFSWSISTSPVKNSSGSIYIDNIEFIYYDEEPTTVIVPYDSLIVYKGETPVDTIFTSNLDLSETTENGPYEGDTHLELAYTSDNWYAGGSFNINRWGGNVRNVTGNTHMVISYKGSADVATNTLVFSMTDTDENRGTNVIVASVSANYVTDTIPLADFVGDSALDLTKLESIIFYVGLSQPITTGKFYLDNIHFINNPEVGFTKNVSDKKSIEAFPNPSHGSFTIKHNVSDANSFTISNILGEEVMTKNISNSEETKVDISNLNKGIYILSLKNNSGIISSQRIIVE